MAASMTWFALAAGAAPLELVLRGRVGRLARWALVVTAGFAGHVAGACIWARALTAVEAGTLAIAAASAVVWAALSMSGHVALVPGLVAALLFCGASAAGLMLVTTSSVPVGLYQARRLAEDRVVERGEYVCLDPDGPHAPASLQAAMREAWVPSRWRRDRFVKEVVAVEGDHVARTADGLIEVNGRALPDSTSVRRGQGSLRPASLPQRLGRDTYWLGSAHPRGLDSRYFGAVKREALGCVAERLWTR